MKKGSITVEAAMVLPIFLFFLMGIMYLFCIISLQSTVQEALGDTANQLSLAGYPDGKEKSGAVIWLDFKMNLKKDFLGKNCIRNGSISLGKSCYDGRNLTLVADYIVRIPVPLWEMLHFNTEQTARTCLFVGRDRREEADWADAGDIRYVYITDTGTVYHETESCPHLKRTVQSVEKENVAAQRNKAGGKYYPCELCVAEKHTGPALVYITPDGNRYHYLRTCFELKRTIKKVPYDSVRTWRACKTCG